MPCAASARISPCLHLRTCTPNSNEASGLLSVQELQDMISSLEERVHLSSHTIHGTGVDLPAFGWFLWYSSMYSKYTFVPWMPWVFLYVPLWRWFPTNVSSDDGKHVVFWFFLCGKKFPRSFSSFVGGPASDRSETVASLISSQRIIPLAKTSGDDLRLGWIGAYKESNLLFRHHRPSRCKKMELLLMLTWKLHSCRWKFQVPPSSFFFLVLLLPVLPGVVLAAARVGTILYFVQDSCNLDWRVEFLVVSNILYFPRTERGNDPIISN